MYARFHLGFRRRWRIVENGESRLCVLDQFRYGIIIFLRSRFGSSHLRSWFGSSHLRSRFGSSLLRCRFGDWFLRSRFRLGQGQCHQLGGRLVGMSGFGLLAADLRRPRKRAGETEFLVGDAADEFEIDGRGFRVSRGLHRRFDQVVHYAQYSTAQFVQ